MIRTLAPLWMFTAVARWRKANAIALAAVYESGGWAIANRIRFPPVLLAGFVVLNKRTKCRGKRDVRDEPIAKPSFRIHPWPSDTVLQARDAFLMNLALAPAIGCIRSRARHVD